MSPQDLADTELPPFRACIQVGHKCWVSSTSGEALMSMASIMCKLLASAFVADGQAGLGARQDAVWIESTRQSAAAQQMSRMALAPSCISLSGWTRKDRLLACWLQDAASVAAADNPT